ncbi:hypothetical protein NZD88_10780 [Chryseobacterium antibioticum]|uniref:Uncharacterized protein n=1 Tax=Chryseobacterium pyrolae TaxID=2987481 RepID=A0ABT2II45_9FLAO|nr:hypothetical protein [Chryseobacterium pyrolae]MCT2408023.1 hypothetical protein [Chryseobacterium pyrolae]
MRFYLFILFFFFQAFALGQAISNEDSISKQKNLEERIRISKESMKIYNELCHQDSLRASIDSKTQNKYFLYNIAPVGSDFPAKEEFKTILEKHNIIWGGMDMSIDRPHIYTPDKCYNIFMNTFTEKKFGENFMQNLVQKSLIEYIYKNPAIIFEHNDHLDWIYENNDAIADSLINKLFFKSFTYPTGYKTLAQKEQSFTEVNLELDETTYILKLESFKHRINNNHNEKFIPHFEKEISKFIKSHNFVLSKREVLHNGVKTSFKIYYK